MSNIGARVNGRHDLCDLLDLTADQMDHLAEDADDAVDEIWEALTVFDYGTCQRCWNTDVDEEATLALIEGHAPRIFHDDGTPRLDDEAKEPHGVPVDLNDPEGAEHAIELEPPDWLSDEAKAFWAYLGDTAWAYRYKGKIVITDESRWLTDHGDGTRSNPYGGPRGEFDNWDEAELWLEEGYDDWKLGEEEVL